MGTIPRTGKTTKGWLRNLHSACRLPLERSLKSMQGPELKLRQFHPSPGTDVQKGQVLAVLVTFSSVQLSLSVVSIFATPWIAARQASLSITNSQNSLKFMSIALVMPFSHLILCCPLLLLPQSLPGSGSFPMSQLFTWGSQSIGVSAAASVLPMNTQDWSPCSPRDSQESPPIPQFKSINSSALSFFHSPTLTSIHDHWKNHSLD